MTVLGGTTFQFFHISFKNELHPVKLIIQTSRLILSYFLSFSLS